jgi:hypothetical protein
MNQQQRGQALIAEFGLGIDLGSRALDLSSEVGEICKEVLKSTLYGAREFQITANLAMEFGDAFFCS